MSLSLKVPALVDNPIMPAITRAHKIQELLSSLPASDALACAATIFEEMENLNRQKVASDTRFQALELYRTKIIQLSALFTEQFASSPLPLSEQAKLYASRTESLWLELGYGYKLALIDSQRKFFNFGNHQKHLAQLTHRALECLREQAMVYHYTYIALPDNIWSEVNQLYLYAAQHHLHTTPVSVGTPEPSDINRVFLHICLMALSNTQHMQSDEIKQTAHYVESFGHLCSLTSLGLVDKSAGIFFISLQSHKGPIAFLKRPKEGDPKTDILIVTIELARKLHQHITQLKTEGVQVDRMLPSYARNADYIALLTRLMKLWSQTPKRHFDRVRKNTSVEIIVGLQAAHQLLKEQTSVTTPSLTENAPPNMPLGTNKWVALNMSAGGVGLRKPPHIKEHLHVGSIISMREVGQPWTIGAVRWVANHEDQQIDIGTELISSNAQPASVRLAPNGPYEKALVILGNATLKQTTSIIAPRGIFKPNESLQLKLEHQVHQVNMLKLLDHSNSYDFFTFSIQ